MSGKRVVVSLGVALMLVVIAWGVWGDGSSWLARRAARSSPNPWIDAVVAAVADRRLVEPRLTGGFAFGPIPPITRGPGTRPLELLSTLVKIGAADNAAPTAGTGHALGVTHLLLGDLDEAVASLERAASRSPADPNILSDLAAAYLTRARATDRRADLPRALAAAARAVKVGPTLAEARFNYALALDAVCLSAQADEAWREYVSREPSTEWAEEGRARHAKSRHEDADRAWPLIEARLLEGRLDETAARAAAEEWPQAVRDAIDHTLLPRFAGEWQQRDRAAADRTLGSIAVAARALKARGGDPLLDDAVAHIRQLPDRDVDRLAEAVKALEQARQRFESYRYASSLPLFRTAAGRLEAIGSPLAWWPRLYEGLVLYSLRKLDAAAPLLERIEREALRAGYRVIAGRTAMTRGLIHVDRAEFSSGLLDYERARAMLLQVHERPNVAIADNLAAELHKFVGEYVEGWRLSYAALSALDTIHDARRRQAVLFVAASLASSEGLFDAAIPFQREMLRIAQSTGVPGAIAEGHANLARSMQRAGLAAETVRELDEAERMLREHHDATLVAFQSAELAVTRGELAVATDPAAALSSLDHAIAYFSAEDRPNRLPALYLSKARAYLKLGNTDEARRALARGLEAFERQREQVGRESVRVSQFDQAWELYDTSIGLMLEQGEPAEAILNLIERSRSRVLLDRWGVNATLSIDAIRKSLKPGTVLVYVEPRATETLAWTVDADGIVSHVLPIAAARAAGLARDYRDGLTQNRPDATATAGALYDALLRPLAARLASARLVVMLPAGDLALVPWAALRDERTGRYLVEQQAVLVAPSGSVFIRVSGPRPIATAEKPLRALVVSSTGAVRDRSSNAILPALPGAAAEAAAIAAGYHEASTLEPPLDKARVMSAFGNADVVHFAGHALVNEEYPLQSRLILGGNDDQTSLMASDLSLARFARTQLVVLAACRTADGSVRRGEGVVSLARTFLGAGVRNVVATLWDVEDESARTLMQIFHERFRAEGDVTQALRSAQLHLLRSNNPALNTAKSWGAFCAIGGSADGRPSSADGR